MSELNELRHRGNNDQSDMIKPFTAVLEGKKLRISTSSDDPGTRARDSNMSAMTGACRHDTAVCSDVAAAPRQSDAMCTYLHKPSAPSPLVNTPLSGKKLPILSRTRNDYLFYTPSEEGKLRKGVSMLDSQVDGEPFICCQSVPNQQDVDGRLHKGTIENNSAYNLLCQTKDESPLTIASISLLPLIKKTVGAVEDNAPSRALNTNAFPLAVAAKNMPESQTNAHTLNPIIDENQISHVKRLHVKPFKVLGTGFRTNRKAQSKAETPKSSKVKYCRGVSYNGANYAYCLHAPYKARVKGVAPELSVCLQYVICYDKKVPPKKFSRTELLFRLAEEKVKDKESAEPQLEKQPTVHKSVIPATSISENKKEHDDIVRGKKKRRKSKSSPENKTEKDGVLCRPVTVSDQRMAHHLSLNDRPVAARRRSSSERRLALHDDFPFHCFLLFQFEDRQKVMKRLTKLPERMQQSLLKKKKSLQDGTHSGVRTKSRHANVTPTFQSHPPKRNSQSVESLVKDWENPFDRSSEINLEDPTNDKVQSKHASREQTKTEDADVEMKLTQRCGGMGEVCSQKPLCDEKWRHSATTTDTLIKHQYVDLSMRKKKKEDDETTVEAAYCGPHEDRQCVNCIGQTEMGQKESTVYSGQNADSTVSYLRTSESKTSLPAKMATEAGCSVEQTNAIDTPSLAAEEYRSEVISMDKILLPEYLNQTSSLAPVQFVTNSDESTIPGDNTHFSNSRALQDEVEEIPNVAYNSFLNLELPENRKCIDRPFSSYSDNRSQSNGQETTLAGLPCICQIIRRTRSSGHLCETNPCIIGVSSDLKSWTCKNKMGSPSPLGYGTEKNMGEDSKLSKTPNEAELVSVEDLKSLTVGNSAASGPANNSGDGLPSIHAAQMSGCRNVNVPQSLSYTASHLQSLPVITAEDSTTPKINNLNQPSFPRHVNQSVKTWPCSPTPRFITFDRTGSLNISSCQITLRPEDTFSEDGPVKDKKLRHSDSESPDSGISLDNQTVADSRVSIQDTYVVSETLVKLNLQPSKPTATYQRHTLPDPYSVSNTRNIYRTEINRKSSRNSLPKFNDCITMLTDTLFPMSRQLSSGYKAAEVTKKKKQSVRFRDVQNMFEDGFAGSGKVSLTPKFPTGNWTTSVPAFGASPSIKRPSMTTLPTVTALPTIGSDFWTKGVVDNSKGPKMIFL